MSPRAVPCDACGSPIGDSDLETGQAVTLLGKRYCAGCKTEAIQSVSLEELSGDEPAPAPRKAAPAPKAAAAKPVPAKPAPPPPKVERKPAPAVSKVRRPAAPASAPPSKTPLIAAVAGAVVLAAAVGGYVAFRGDPGKTGDPVPVKGSSAAATGAVSANPEARAKAAYTKVQELASQTGTSWDVLLAAVDQARPACKGSAFEKPLEAIADRARKEKESEDSARELAPLIDELKGAVATDPEFKRYSELQPKFQLAIETGAKTGSSRVAEIRALLKDYNSRYEKLAEPYYNDIYETATALADERRYDDAIRKIETFPQPLRNSNTWQTLAKLRQDIEKRKKK